MGNTERKKIMNKRKIWIAAGSLLIFAAISYIVTTVDVLSFDTVVRETIYGFRSDGRTVFFRTITYLGNWETISAICIATLLFRHNLRSPGIPLAATGIIAVVIQKSLKIFFHRARPDIALHLIHQGGYSFPSGHSFSVLVFYGMIIFLCHRHMKNRTAANTVTVLLSILIALIGFSRIYLGVHFPTDVLGGWSLGLCLLMILTSGYHYYTSVIK